MPLLFKMQKTLVTFSLILILKVRILGIPKLSRNVKGYLYHKTFKERGEIRKRKIHMWPFWLPVMFTGLLFTTKDMKKKKKIKDKCFNEIKCWVYTVLHLVLFVKMKNIITNKIPNGRYLKNLILQKVV